MERSFQAIFYVAAFIQITQLPRDLYAQADPDRSVEYDTTRPLSGGMNIVARNLSFSYPRQTKPALRNIDLTIPAGQTLAIVGFNGGGKTTLVKVLMGLYDYGGELLINGVSARSIDKQSLYARTSCLFQDYNRYPVTVRENVGVGRVDKMNDKEAILRAMERGKADAVVRHVGSVEAILAPEELQESSAMGNDDEEDEGRDKAKPSGGGDAGAAKAAGEADESGKVATAEKEETGSAVVNGEDPERQLSTEQEKMNRKETYHALSGGQWQRIALARAFLRAEDADLVVFE
jgi:ABC-type multidrug transport system fused ATPase/permease subunit